MKNKLSNFIQKNEKWLIILLFVSSLFSFFVFTGTLNSGYHFIDDHCLISMKENLNKDFYLKTTYTFVKNDFLIRFRPAFYFYYVSFSQIFGLNFFAMSIFVGFLAVFTFLLFYFSSRNLKFSILESTLFVLFVFIGNQSSIWWRLGVAESIAVFFLGLAFFFLTKCSQNKNYKWNNILFIVFLSITSLCKESFIFVIPALLFLKIWLEKENSEISVKESIRKNLLTSTFLLILMFIELLIIKFVVGTNQIGYAGVTSSITEFFNGVINIIFSRGSLLEWFKFLGYALIIYFVSFLFLGKEKREKFTQSMRFFLPNLIFVLLILLPQIFVHAKSGMVERYLLPTTLSLAFLFVVIFKDVKLKFFKILLFIVFSIFISNSFFIIKEKAIDFTEQGKQANFLFGTIMKNIEKEDEFLLVTDPVSRYEISNSIKIYFSYFGYNNLYVQPILKEYKNDFEIGLKNSWTKWFEGKMLKDLKDKQNLKLIIIFSKKDEENDKFFLESGIDKNKYQNVTDEKMPYRIYIKN